MKIIVGLQTFATTWISDAPIMEYCMVQNFDGGSFDEWASGKFWRKNFDEATEKVKQLIQLSLI